MIAEQRCAFCFGKCKNHRNHSEYCSAACERAAKKWYVANPVPPTEVTP